MALNNFDAKILTRSNGGNAVYTAAYNNRQCFKDDRTGEKRDYRSKGRPEFSGFFLPQDAPQWAKDLVKDREKFWNAVEDREQDNNKVDQAQVARNWIIALPHELNRQQRKWLVTDFAREMARKGMILDVNIHEPDAHSDKRNYHAHILVTMRSLDEDGFGNKVRSWNKVSELEAWKERWSELGEKALRKAAREIGSERLELEADRFRHGHRTKEVQGREATKRGDFEFAETCRDQPTIKEGPNVRAMERRGIVTEIGTTNRIIKARNKEKAIGRGLAKAGVRTVEKTLDVLLGVFDGPKLTPEQIAQGERAQRMRDAIGQDAVRRRQEEAERNQSRDR